MKKSKLLLVSFILGIFYILFSIFKFQILSSITDTTYIIDGFIAGLIITFIKTFILIISPYFIFLVIATVLNIFAYFKNSIILTILSGVCYVVSALFGLLHILFILPMIILTFSAIPQVKKLNKK